MPGIAAIISRAPGEGNARDLGIMLGCMKHEPFYVSGTCMNERLGVYAGWVGIRGSFSDCMPVWNESKDACLIFSGENFADRTEIEELKAKGHVFNGSDASYLIHLYEEEGENFFSRLNGWFVGILMDLRKGKAILFNDRIGMKRVYIHESKDAFYCATEAKALLKIRPELREFDPSGLGEYLSFWCVLNGKTLFRNIHLLPGGSAWAVEGDGSIKKDSYFRPDILERNSILDTEAYYEELKATFARILPRYFSGKEAVGISLTGGLDSRMILAWKNAAPGTLPCYTFGGMYRDCYDVKVARKVAKSCGQIHKVIPVDKGFFKEFQDLARKTIYISDGGLDVTGATELYVNRVAREIAPVRVTGTYGGEVLRRIVNFKPEPSAERLLQNDLKMHVRNASQTYSDVRKGNPLTFAVFKQAPWFNTGRLSLEQSQLTVRSPFLDGDFVKAVYRAPAEAFSSKDISLRLIADGNPALRKIMTDRGFAGDSGYLISKAARLFLELTFKAEYAYDIGMPQWMAGIDHVLAPLHLEKIFLGRHKFYHFRGWFRDELSGYVRDLLLDSRARKRPYWENGVIERIVQGHLKGGRNHSIEIIKVMTVELIHRHLLENE